MLVLSINVIKISMKNNTMKNYQYSLGSKNRSLNKKN